MSDFRTLTSAFAAAAVLLAPVAARADATSDAKDLFVQGRTLRSEGRCVDALPLFRHALELYPEGLGSERNIAECEEQLGHFAAARHAWSDLARALSTNQDARYAGWSHDADEAVARLAGQVATLTVKVGGGRSGEPQGAVTVNGAPLPPASWGTPFELDPGHYVVRYQGEVPQVRPLDLSSGETRSVELHAVAPAPVTALAPTPPRPRDEGQPLRIGGWVAVGLGLAGFVGVGISGAVYEDARRTVDVCNGPKGPCTPMEEPYSGAQKRGQTAATLVNVFVGVGAGGVATGLVLFVLGHGISPKSEVALTPDGVAVTGRF